MKYRNIRVKKSGGGYRTQRAMVLASGKLKFVSNKSGHGKARRKKHTHRRKHRHHSTGAHVAKRRRRRSSKHITRRRHHGGGGGSIMGVIPMSDLKLAAGAGAFGWAENQAKTDANFVLNKIPKMIDGLGWTGNTTLGLYLINKFLFRNRWLAEGAKAGAAITAYQFMRRGGKAFTKADEFFTVSGADYLSGDEAYLDDHTMGALAADAQGRGLTFEDEVHNALAHT